MKRIFIALFLVLSFVICLPSCFNTQENADFEKFNEMLNIAFDNYQITVLTSSPNGYVLNNSYNIKSIDGVSKIEYHVETLNEFTLENGNNIIPNGYKTVSEGVCENAQNTPGLDLYYNPHFKLSSDSISSYTVTPELFSAQIASLSGFMGLDKGLDEGYVSSANLSISYSENRVNSLEITYVTHIGNTVVITYTFN